MKRPRRRSRVAEDAELVASCVELTTPGMEIFLESIVDDADTLLPPEDVDIVDWLRENVSLPKSVSDRSGSLVLNPIQALIARLWRTTGIHQVTLLKSTRFGSTLVNAGGLIFHAGHLGFDVIFYERSEGDAQDFHDKKLLPILQNSEDLAHLLRPDSRSGVQDSWTDRILTNGASIQLRSASNNGSFRAIKGAFICVDEAGAPEYRDRSKKSEGSKLALIRRRAQEYAAPVIYVGGTPTTVGTCMVSAEFERSTQHDFAMPCPHCREFVVFKPDVREVAAPATRLGPGIRYTIDEDGVVLDAWYECECGEAISETHKSAMMDKGKLVLRRKGEPGHIGVFTWAAHSTDLQMTWRHIGGEHQKSLTDHGEAVSFRNTILSLPYDPAPMTISTADELIAGAMDFGRFDAPDDVEFGYIVVDNQKGTLDDLTKMARGEVTIVGCGPERRDYVLDHVIISHVPTKWDEETGEVLEEAEITPFDPDYMQRLHDLARQGIVTRSGKRVPIEVVFVDVGWRTEHGHRMCMHPVSKDLNFVPIRGSTNDRGGNRDPVLPKSLNLRISKRSGRGYLWIGTQMAKDEVARRFSIAPGNPDSYTFSKRLPRSYFEGLLSERQIEKNGTIRWEKITTDVYGEPFDNVVYGYAARKYVLRKNRRRYGHLDRTEAEVGVASSSLAPPVSTRPAAVEEVAAPPMVPTLPDLEAADPPGQSPATTLFPVPAPEQARVLTPAQRFRLERGQAAGAAPARPAEDDRIRERLERIKSRKARTGAVGW